MVEQSIIKSETKVLAKFETDALETLSPEYREIIRAKYEPKISTYQEFQQVDYMKVIVKELMIHTQSNHLQLSEELLEYNIKSFAAMAIGELRSLSNKFTLSEAKIALREGYRGSYSHFIGEIYGLSAVNFAKCFRAYDIWEKRLDAQKEFNKAIDNPTTEKPIADLFPKNLENAVECFECFKREPKAMNGTTHSTETGFYHLPTIFNFLNDNFVLNFSPETKAMVLDKAKKDYWKFINKGLTYQQKLDGKLQTLIDSVKLEANKTFDYYCDSEGLRVLFTKLIERNKSITDLKKKD